MDLCRRKGVESLTLDGLSLKLSDYVPKKAAKSGSQPSDLGEELQDWDSLSPEEQLFYSTGGIFPPTPEVK